MTQELAIVLASTISAILIFVGGLVGVWVSARHNRLTNQNQVKDLQLKMIDQLQEERNHTEQLLKEERILRVKEIADINRRFEKYKDVVREEKTVDREYINNLKHHIEAGEPPPPPAPPPGFKP